MLKGVLEGCVMEIISRGQTYGYEIMLKLSVYGFTDISEGTIYPLLVRLEKKGLILAEFKPSPLGPSRKYYTLTSLGLEALAAFKTYWQDISEKVSVILSLGGN